MRYEVALLPLDQYNVEDLLSDIYPEDLLATGYVFYDETVIPQLLDFLFQGKVQSQEIYRDANAYILDLAASKPELITFDYLDSNYQQWLTLTGRENTMDEYGMLIDFIGIAQRGKTRNHLLLLVAHGNKG